MSPKIVPTEFYDTFRPTPMVVLDTRYMRANAVRVLEQILWGSDNPNVDAYLPDINELIELYRSSAYDVKTTYLGDGLWRAEEEMGEDLSTDGEYFEADLRKAENGLEGEWTLDTDYDTSEETRNDRN